jgi:hypothetical protein
MRHMNHARTSSYPLAHPFIRRQIAFIRAQIVFSAKRTQQVVVNNRWRFPEPEPVVSQAAGLKDDIFAEFVENEGVAHIAKDLEAPSDVETIDAAVSVRRRPRGR